MSAITPQLVLRCSACEWRPPPDAVMEAVYLHQSVEHEAEQDQVHLDLVAVCTCGAEMVHTGTTPLGLTQQADHFLCTFDNTTGVIVRDVKP